MTYYDDSLKSLQQQKARKAHLEVVLKDLCIQREELRKKVSILLNAKENEQTDVDRLEKSSLTAFFYSVVGKKEEKLDKERQEAYEAAVKYDSAACELKAVEDDIKCYEDELAGLKGCEEKFARALDEKAQAVKNTDSLQAAEIIKLEEELIALENKKKEILEAISAAQEAKKTADKVLSELNTAEGWGTFDLLGGGVLSDIAKHNSIDKAQRLVEQLQIQLRRFKTELSDVAVYADMQVSIDGFLRFADYFFDGLFADWAVLDKIEKSKQQVEKTKEQIGEVVNTLKLMVSTAENEQSKIKQKLNELIVNATI